MLTNLSVDVLALHDSREFILNAESTQGSYTVGILNNACSVSLFCFGP